MSPRPIRICTWNVNGIRTLPTPLKTLLDNLHSDVICFQETKCSRDLDSHLACVDGYNAYFNYCPSRPGYSGVAIFCRDPIRPITAGEGFVQTLACADPNLIDPADFLCSQAEISRLELKQLESEGRLVSVVLPTASLKIDPTLEDSPARPVYLISVYVPRVVESDAKRVEFRRLFERTFSWLSLFLSQTKHVVICGDLNVCHTARDHCELEEFETHSSMVLTARQWINHLLVLEQRDPTIQGCDLSTPGTFVDVFRHIHPTRSDAYTCWSSRTGARATNYGVRLDYILADRALMSYADAIPVHAIQADLLTDQLGSDHCPVWTELPLYIGTNWDHPYPSQCSRNWPQCQRKQTNLTTFVARSEHQPETNTHNRSMVMTNGDGECSGGSCFKRTAVESHSVFADKAGAKWKLKQAKLLIVQPAASSLSTIAGVSNIPGTDSILKTLTPTQSSDKPSAVTQTSVTTQSAQSVDVWRRILTGPKKPPLCRGHSEPCVLRTVKQERTASGARRGKRFWVCARPQGAKDNPMARCETFIWDDQYQDKKTA